jgi:hypothetical protein
MNGDVGSPTLDFDDSRTINHHNPNESDSIDDSDVDDNDENGGWMSKTVMRQRLPVADSRSENVTAAVDVANDDDDDKATEQMSDDVESLSPILLPSVDSNDDIPDSNGEQRCAPSKKRKESSVLELLESPDCLVTPPGSPRAKRSSTTQSTKVKTNNVAANDDDSGVDKHYSSQIAPTSATRFLSNADLFDSDDDDDDDSQNDSVLSRKKRTLDLTAFDSTDDEQDKDNDQPNRTVKVEHKRRRNNNNRHRSKSNNNNNYDLNDSFIEDDDATEVVLSQIANSDFSIDDDDDDFNNDDDDDEDEDEEDDKIDKAMKSIQSTVK